VSDLLSSESLSLEEGDVMVLSSEDKVIMNLWDSASAGNMLLLATICESIDLKLVSDMAEVVTVIMLQADSFCMDVAT
jgi:hypothetical protein